MKTFTFSLVLRTRENTDVFITLDENIFGIHSKRVNILYISNTWKFSIFIFPTGRIRVCEIFPSTGVICGNPYPVRK